MSDDNLKNNHPNNNTNYYIDQKIKKIINKYNATSDNKIIKNLILSGGGIRGIAHIGALKALEEHNILKNITTITGASIGGIIAALYCIGYTPDEMFKIIDLLDMKNLKCVVPSFFLNKFGVDDGKKIIFILEQLFENKKISKNITFAELYKINKIKLILSTVCINDKQVHYLSHLSHPDMPIIIAMRMTSSVPLLFTPVIYQNKMYVDGGCIDNYPITLFAKELDLTIGLYLFENREYKKNIDNLEDYLFNLMQCLFEGISCNSTKGYEKNTISIYTSRISLITFDISQTIKKQLYDCGYSSVKKYFDPKIN